MRGLVEYTDNNGINVHVTYRMGYFVCAFKPKGERNTKRETVHFQTYQEVWERFPIWNTRIYSATIMLPRTETDLATLPTADA